MPAVNLTNTRLPVFFLQLGNNTSLFFDRVLQQAALSNGIENVFVLTDTNFELYRCYNCIDISGYTHVERPFDQLYKHYSTNTYFFEKTCLDRWFIINELITDLGIKNFVYADCDVLLLQDLKPVYNDFISEKYDGTMMFFEDGENSITSAHTSFWNAKLLADFCSFINARYADEAAFNKMLADTLSGKFYNNRNVSDMILLSAFRTETRPVTISLLSLEEKGICFDFNINAGYNGNQHTFELTTDTKIKRIIKQNGSWYGRTADVNHPQYFNFYTLHFQGYLTKALIPLYVSPRGLLNRIANLLAGRTAYVKRRARMFKNKLKYLVKGGSK